jgi:hypothetical protein
MNIDFRSGVKPLTVPAAAQIAASGDFSFLMRRQRNHHRFITCIVCHITPSGFRIYTGRGEWERDYLPLMDAKEKMKHERTATGSMDGS